jgi:SAM-dependent methyltransferase
MDAEDVTEQELEDSLRFIARVNRHLGGTRAVLGHLQRWSRHWRPGRCIRILDLGTGGGDIPAAIVRWAATKHHAVQVTALERHPLTLRLARKQLQAVPKVALVRGDALKPPFAPGSFDYVLASMFLHHLGDIEVLTVLKIMDDLALRGIIWNDLLRHRRALSWTWLLTRGQSPIVRHDATASVRAGFVKAEVLDLRRRLGLEHLQYHQHFGHRFTLAGQRRGLR